MAKRMVDTNTWVRTFEVTEPTRHRKGFTVYKVTSVVFPRSFPESATKITIWKRYSDFRKLHKELELIFKQLYLKGEFPVFPKAKVFGRFEHEVVEERRKAALILLEFTANHTQLFTSKPFMQFFENGYSSQDFIEKILFSKGDHGQDQDPPATVLQEKSEILTPCLKPVVLWNTNENPSNEGDTVSLSPSSVSSSISPTESADTMLSPRDPKPCTSTSTPSSNLVQDGNVSSCEQDTTAVVAAAAEAYGSSNHENNHSSSGNVRNITLQSSLDLELKESKTSKLEQAHRANGIVRSATVTDELSSYFDEEFEDAAFLFPTGSCSSLDTLPGFTPSSDVVDSTTQKEIPSSSRGLFTLPRRKTNGFGFFDFLPLFPKKSAKKSVTKDKEEKSEPVVPVDNIKKTSLSVGYICEAAGHFAVAQFHESNADYELAFTAYKEGIRVLLAGAQDDTDRERKLLAKNKLEKYLARAESLKETYLSSGIPTCGHGSISPVFSSPNKKQKSLSALTRSMEYAYHQSGKHLLCSLEDLKPYKVIGIGPTNSKILIVMNPEETSPKCYATKVLWKSSCVIYPDKPTIIPCHIPFMVKLLKWFQTQEKIILLLEHAGGGRLEEFVKNYQSKRLSLSTPPDELSPAEESKIVINDVGNGHEPVDDGWVQNQDSSGTNEATVTKVSINEELVVVENEQELLRVDSQEIVMIDNELSSENEVFSTPALSPENEDSNSTPDVLDVRRLLENSKALLQTVSRTLENSNSPKKIPMCRTVGNEGIQNVAASMQLLNIESDSQPSAAPVNTRISVAKVSEVDNEEGRKNSHKDSDVVEDFDEDMIPKRMVPEGVIKVWAAEIVIALEALHDVGVTYGDLQIRDILLGENGHILLRYKSLWTEIDDKIAWNAYTAPEVRDSIGVPLWKMHSAADWWSLGAILFLLLTGQSLHAAHPEGIYPEMIVKVPDISLCETPISKSAQTLMKELLQYSPEVRLGFYGAAEIKTHPFFEGFDWGKAIDECGTEK